MQSEILAERVKDALRTATFLDQYEAREARRYVERIDFALGRVGELRASAAARQGAFEDARLGVALTILEGHVIHAANFVDGVVLRQHSEIAKVNRRIAAQLRADTAPPAAARAGRAA
jgi:hypothetical protein